MADGNPVIISKMEELSPLKRAYLQFNAASPLVIMIICLWWLKNIILAVYTFQILSMVILPAMYIMMNDDLKAYEVLMRRLLRGAAHQWPYAVASFFVCALGGVGLFLLIQAFHVVNRKEVVGVAEKDGLNGDEISSAWMVIFLAVEFTFGNSLLEEFFWRVFLYRELGNGGNDGGGGGAMPARLPRHYDALLEDAEAGRASRDGSAGRPNREGSAGRTSREGSKEPSCERIDAYNSFTNFLTPRTADEDGVGSDTDSPPISPMEANISPLAVNKGALGGGSQLCCGLLPAEETPKLLISCYYASYHVVVLLCFVEWYLVFPCFFCLVALGRILVFCRECEKFGILTGWGLHAGLDGAFCLIMIQLYTRFL